MGNSLGAKKTAKVMKINGETLKLKIPVEAGEVVKDYPGHVLLDSEAVKHYGVRAKALEAHQKLEPRRLYFLVELPQTPKVQVPRRAWSGINMSAKDRLEGLMLARRSVSDLTSMKPTSIMAEESGTRVRMRLPKADVEKLLKESRDEAEAAEKIMDLCRAQTSGNVGEHHEIAAKTHQHDDQQQQEHWKLAGHGGVKEGIKGRDQKQKRVSFMPINEGETQIAVASR
ncbi:hypothetical protein FH972_008600 [Carpinus fangiana]|uniref:Plastid movement impaired protein n=1 Tax=Carpinus fangiana TaxID=176857 RepID=A0A5N6R2A1_9ROSI|nr:hypothetical protein FH972_008600 [Carpinus fangiana]